jgi:hypothetical protein
MLPLRACSTATAGAPPRPCPGALQRMVIERHFAYKDRRWCRTAVSARCRATNIRRVSGSPPPSARSGASVVPTSASRVWCGDNQITSQEGTPTPNPTVSPTPCPADARRLSARDARREAAEMAYARGVEPHVNNGDEDRYKTHFASFSKALPHDDLGVVDPTAYAAYLHALSTGRPDDFEAIPLGGTVKLANPQAGELVELYWMALARDVPFNDYASDQTIAAACDDLSALTDFRGPKSAGLVTPGTIFRGLTPGDLAGPTVSQFLLRDFTSRMAR